MKEHAGRLIGFGIFIVLILISIFVAVAKQPNADSLSSISNESTLAENISGILLDENDLPLADLTIDSITDEYGNVVVDGGSTDANGAFDFATGTLDPSLIYTMNLTLPDGTPVSVLLSAGGNGAVYPATYANLPVESPSASALPSPGALPTR